MNAITPMPAHAPGSPRKGSTGFTLVEIAIVLVIIGLLLGGILKGQELINSARVRNLADTTSAVQAAYFGFLDRFRQVPGDWGATPATTGIGETITGGGNNDGSLNHPNNEPWTEPNALWEQLSAAGFIQGAYNGTVGTSGNVAPTTDNGLAPVNAFNGVILVGRSNDYLDTNAAPGSAPARLHVVIGRFVPAEIMRELDLKMDDGRPASGDLRAARPNATLFQAGTTGGVANGWGGTGADNANPCVNPATGTGGTAFQTWNAIGDPQDCNGVFFF